MFSFQVSEFKKHDTLHATGSAPITILPVTRWDWQPQRRPSLRPGQRHTARGRPPRRARAGGPVAVTRSVAPAAGPQQPRRGASTEAARR